MQGGRLEKRRKMIGNVDRQAKKSQSTTTVIVNSTTQKIRALTDVLLQVIDRRIAFETDQGSMGLFGAASTYQDGCRNSVRSNRSQNAFPTVRVARRALRKGRKFEDVRVEFP